MDLEEKLKKLQEQLEKLETEGEEKIRQKRIDSDMGDDYRENELAKMAMMDHDIWYIRKVELKKEIGKLRKKIILQRG